MADDPTTLYGDPEQDRQDRPRDSWLDLIEAAQRRGGFADWQRRADNVDKQYADMRQLASETRDRQMQVFWANIQVLAPSIYSRPPVPVVVPRFRGQDELPRIASELLERGTVSTFAAQDIDGVMRLVRDDLVITGRGVVWLRFETESRPGDPSGERVCIEYLDRRDFIHDPARTWRDVDWVARRAYLTKAKAKTRFPRIDWDSEGAFEERTDELTDLSDGKKTIEVWEIWCRSANRVVWVSEGVDKILDDGPPHLNLEGFFPCPRPAYGTTQRGSLIPIPDFVYYKDQIEEINQLTNRIAALAESIKLRFFYPSGQGDLGDAVEAALKSIDDRTVGVPVSNWAMMSGDASKTIAWLPIDMVATTITQLVELRKQLIDDVYQITGLSDIMRGATEASETATAQQIKSQYGSIRVRDRRDELVRMARDIARMAAEIMAENFSADTLFEMAQMDMPRDKDIAAQKQAIHQQILRAQTNPQLMQMAQQKPDAAMQVLHQAQQQIASLDEKPTVEKIMKFLKDQRLRAFAIDIETDSTIQADEDANKQRVTEAVTAIGGLLREGVPAVQQVPQIAPLLAETLKLMVNTFRVDRDFQDAVDHFADSMEQMAGQPKPNPEADAAQAKMQIEQMRGEAELKARQIEGQARIAEIQQKAQFAAQQHQQDMERGAIQLQGERLKVAAAELAHHAAQAAAAQPSAPPKPPAEAIAFGDLPPEGQAQMAAQAGIMLSPEQIQAHADLQDAKDAAQAQAAAQAKASASASPGA